MSLSRSEFFSRVLPPTGYFCLLALMDDESAPPITEFYPISTVLEGGIDARAETLDLVHKRETYFGCASFATPTKRRVKNTAEFKCFKFDLDCGADKPYDTQQDGLDALRKFLTSTGLPTPLLVNSGNGIHGYWTLDVPCNYNQWKPLANALRKAMLDLDFIVDPSVTADGARVLRIPGSHNNKKRDRPLPVKVMTGGADMTLDQFRSFIEAYIDNHIPDDMESFQATPGALGDPLMRKLAQSSEKVFAKILTRSLETQEIVEANEIITEVNGIRTAKTQKQKVVRSAGCAQIAHIFTDQEHISYDLWRAGLSIARNCVDWEEAIHLISNRDEDRYSYAKTIEVAEGTFDKPQKCATFQQYNPELCLKCPIRSKISTPITLGFRMVEAEAIDHIQDDVWHKASNTHIDVEIPITYPSAWLRPKMGGVAKRGLVEEDDAAKIVYENDLWVSKLTTDPVQGTTAHLACIFPKDGLVEFPMPIAWVNKKDKCIEHLGFHGVAIRPDKTTAMATYILDWTNFLQKQAKTEVSRSQFGWHDSDTVFVIGSREYRPDGTVVTVPTCMATETVAALYTIKGELKAWVDMVNNTYARPGNEARCFVLFASMGTPLYKFFSVNSCLGHLTNAVSGVGKTSALMMGNSVWGEPKKTLLTKNDTALARQQRVGVLNNLPVMVDEITNFIPAEMSEFAFSFSEDRGRNRMQSQVNAERKNTTSWCTLGFTSGNNSAHDVLDAHSSSGAGEKLRLVDIEVLQDTGLTKVEADHYFHHVLRDNYGLAGDVLLRYYVSNKAEVYEMCMEEQKIFDEEAGFGSQARTLSAMCVTAIVGAKISKQLGLHNIDVDRVRRWMRHTFGTTVATILQDTSSDALTILGEFFNEHTRNILIINDRSHVSDNTLPVQPLREPMGPLIIRYEPNTRRVYIARDALKLWCANKRIPYTPFIRKLHGDTGCTENQRMCLSRGTTIPGSPIWVEKLDADSINWQLDTDTPVS